MAAERRRQREKKEEIKLENVFWRSLHAEQEAEKQSILFIYLFFKKGERVLCLLKTGFSFQNF